MNSIYQNIVRDDRLSLKKKLKGLAFYFSRKRGAVNSWEKRHGKVFSRHTAYKQKCNSEIESEHQKKWSVFRREVDMSTLRICKNISGDADPRIVPEDIFVSDIEPTLTKDEACHFLSHKSFYNRWFPKGVFPEGIFHCIDGQYLDEKLHPISRDKLEKIAGRIAYPVVFKPNWHTYGGEGVHFVANKEELLSLCEESNDFVVQKKVNQHDFFQKYNALGLNTIRVYVYKSVSDNTPHILNMALRMGREGSLDNLSAGGIQSMIRETGFLNSYAVDKYGQRFDQHPDTGVRFDEKIPNFDGLKKLSLQMSKYIFFTHIVGLDLCYDDSGNWRVIEINTKGHTIRFSQYGGKAFFGEHTEEVIQYCQRNHWTLNKAL